MSLGGSVFEGHLQAPGLGRCGLSYRFEAAVDVPAGVKSQRRQLGWTTKDICCYKAVCSIPDLGLESEEVVISVDPAREDGSRLLLLQSLVRPDLGLTVLSLDSSSSSIQGGDESWTPGAEPIIRAQRCGLEPKAKPKAAPRPPPLPSSPVRPKTVRTEPDAEPVPGSEEPSTVVSEEKLLGFGVVGGSDGLDTEEVSSCMPLPMGDDGRAPPQTAPRGGQVGGIGRSAGASISKPSTPAGYKDAPLVRPDMAAGKPGALVQELGSAGTDAEIQATAAANQERFVAAAFAGETGDVQQLLGRAGVRLDGLVDQGRFARQTALMAAATRGRTDVVRVLLERKANPDVKDPDGWTALMHGIHGQRIDVCKLLLDAKADFQQAAEDGSTPLILAAAGARHELCKALLAKKAALGVADAEGCTALHHAARRGHGASVVTLLSARAKLEKQDLQGRTPLLAAASAGRADTVRLLLAQGADTMASDTIGRTAKELATAYQHDRVLKVLQEKRIKE
ncbi:unnamed protein product [Effrenium voratum]|uniref:Uncharacterized protein n=1 Tax=Effrenium voratum TaxID=2562239 RepID=A0AA36MGU5_9DINO|nr:unnamed protein product [Effrenium voratum]CAJ1423836.1 unnamed protein product [Effrenium voratum]